MPNKWQQRLMCATPGIFVKNASVCTGYGGLEPIDSGFAPHAIIINLGQNDFGSTPDHVPSASMWINAYTAFVRNISATYDAEPVRPIFFLACGGMDTKYCNATAAAVHSMNTKGLLVYFLDISASGAGAWKNGSTEGCDSHPSVTSHALMAAQAEPTVRTVMGW
jgi:hypothetical protein